MKRSYICIAKRTAIGSFQGTLSKLSSPEIASALIEKALPQDLDKTQIDEAYMGCVLTAGIGQAPARQAILGAKLPDSLPCTTISKVCGSGLKSLLLADQSIRAGINTLVLAGGMENMSQAPYLLPKMREGLRLGHGKLIDSMVHDGLWDAYNDYHMGNAAEECAQKYEITREDQDRYAVQSYEQAIESRAQGLFKDEITPLTIQSRKKSIEFDSDEELDKFNKEKFSQLRAAFIKDGSVTAGNASSLSDGAAITLIASEEALKANPSLKAIAVIHGQSQAAQEAKWFSTAPAKSIDLLFKNSEITKDKIDFWEINEAFSVVALANMKLLELDPKKVNSRGGAVALGHPIGASGCRIVVTLLHSLMQEKKKYGVASICIGGGEANSILVENLVL